MPPASRRPDCSSTESSDSFSQEARLGSSNLNALWDTELHIHDDWKEFRNQWWGPTGKTRLAGGDGTIITLEQETVWRTLVSYNFTQGQIYVRSEYELMYQRLCNAHKTVDAPSQRQIPGVILSGQPGIGKSYFGLYVLLQCMAHEQPIVFFSNIGTAVYIDAEGVRMCYTEDVTAVEDFPDVDRSISGVRTWSVIDSDAFPENITCPSLFFVLCSSPPEAVHHHLEEDLDVKEWVMNPWTEEELLILLTTSGMVPWLASIQNYTLAMVRDLRSQVGPSPVDIKFALHDPKLCKREVQEAIWTSLGSPSSLSESYVSCMVVLLKRVGELDPAVLCSDSTFVTLKTASIVEALRTRYKEPHLDYLQPFFRAYKPASDANMAAMAGVVFEGIAVRLLSYRAPDGPVVFDYAGYARMALAPASPAPKRKPPSFEHHSEHFSGSTLVVDRDGAVQLVEDEVAHARLASSPAALGVESCPVPVPVPVPGIPIPMDYTTCSDVTAMGIHSHKCFVPTVPNAPFDAYFVVPTTQETMLWIVQVAVSHNRNRNGRPAGFPTVRDLVARVQKAFGLVRVRYMLMVPDGRRDLSVQWHLGEDFSEVKVDDEAFIQFVRTSPSLKFEDVIRLPAEW